MERLKLIVRAPFSLKAIYELRNTPIMITAIMIILIGILHFTPFTLTFMGTMPYERHLAHIWRIPEGESIQIIQTLPVGCNINDLALNCSEIMTIQIRDDFSVLINHDNIITNHGLIFMPYNFQIISDGASQEFSYFHLQGLDFDELRLQPDGNQVLFSHLAIALQGVLMAPFILNSYLTGIISFLPYILGVSALSMLLKFGHSSFLKYREVLNIIVFSSFLPTMILIIVGFFNPAFTTLILNFMTPVIAYFVYKKYVIPGLQNIEPQQVYSQEEL